ncbi:hypothetical protein [Desulfosediminicola sp.]|uniref:hypothetical protein n=1 Tax=Desulfosediminicola sp. TaxID=2886825 RepID=UPI003AF1E305
MGKDFIQVTFDSNDVRECSSVILVPEKAMEEPGYIKTMSVGEVANIKHEFHAMAQMAYYQYQDDELDIVSVGGVISVSQGDMLEKLDSGMVICRDPDGEFQVVIHAQLNRKKMLETTNRYCTRWVRLDI